MSIIIIILVLDGLDAFSGFFKVFGGDGGVWGRRLTVVRRPHAYAFSGFFELFGGDGGDGGDVFKIVLMGHGVWLFCFGVLKDFCASCTNISCPVCCSINILAHLSEPVNAKPLRVRDAALTEP